MRPTFIVLISIAAGTLAGCIANGLQGRGETETLPSATAALYQKPSDLTPDALPYVKARINMAGTEVPAELQRKVNGENVLFLIVAKGETLEEEHYISTDTNFSFVSLGGEAYSPAIPIVRYPFRVGESWEWSGTASLGPISKPATATLVSAPETLNLATGVSECVLVSASLVVQTGGGAESKRDLKFWIEPKRGVVKRAFGSSTTREPRPPNSLP